MNREDKATLKPIKEDQEYALGLLLDVAATKPNQTRGIA